MNFKASNLYISIIDLFAILLPGAIASLVVYHFYQEAIEQFLNIGEDHQAFYSGFVLLFASYLFGHIINQLSSYLDKLLYDRFKNKIFRNQKRLNEVKRIRKEHYGNEVKNSLVNTFNWSVFKLQKEQPYASGEIERYIADSKFFRSLFAILLVLLIVFMVQQHWFVATSCLLLAAFSLARYFIKRRKATETAYQYIIFSELLNIKGEGLVNMK